MLELALSFGGLHRLGPPEPPRRRFGVPPGGPFDRVSHALLARLGAVGDAWEVAFGSTTFVARADGSLIVAEEGQAVRRRIAGGEEATVGTAGRAYVAFGPDAPPARTLLPPPPDRRVVRVLPGPDPGFEALLDREWRVTTALDRIGVRLDGEPLPHALELPSRPCVPGVVQLPPDGLPLVLGPDGPTIGGYPQPFVVVSEDLSLVGRWRVGEVVRFAVVGRLGGRAVGADQKGREGRA